MTETTAELVRRSRDRDGDAFERLYRQHVGAVYALCLRMTGDPAHAGELVQDVFVRAWVGLPGFRGDSSFKTWLHRLALNAVRDDQRDAIRSRARYADGEGLLDGIAGPLEMGPESRIALERAIAALPPKARDALILHDIHGYRCHEVAELTGTAVGTIQAHLHRARKRLRELLSR